MTTTKTKPLTVEEARELGDELLRQLAAVYGDEDEVNAVARRWLDVLGGNRFALVCMAALQTTFVSCLSPPPDSGPPPGALEFHPKERNADAQA